jgi:hypothetical protein
MLNECISCEVKYEESNSTATKKFEAQYCSIECEQKFEQFLEAEVERAELIGLIDKDGALVLQSENVKQTVDRIIHAYGGPKSK